MRFNPLQSKLISCAFKLADTAHKGPQVGLQALHYTGFSRLYDAAALREVQKLLKKYKTADIFYAAYFPFIGLAMKHEVMLFCNYFIINPPSLGVIITVYFLL